MERIDTDSPWKDVLESFFEDFVAFFFPAMWSEIDWTRAPDFLDKEMLQLMRGGAVGHRLADKLVRVHRRDGTQSLLMVHIEVQASREPAFAERMMIYHYRIFDRYRKPVVSVAVLTDEEPSWRPSAFERSGFGCRFLLEFPVVKLLDYRERLVELPKHPNPFGLVVAAHLRTLQCRGAPEQRMKWKLELCRGLYDKDFSQADVLSLFRVLDWLLVLPAELEASFWMSLSAHEEEQQMPYLATFERKAEQKGLEKGQRGVLRRQLTRRFGELPDWAEERLLQGSPAEFERWADRILEEETLEAVLAPES
ncbi:MAG: hypothetical protein RBU37_14290 [Myxococcota bacterium]|jgi:hypothetical protein|nr:hypothetical protein [Myxococcota bacterium]